MELQDFFAQAPKAALGFSGGTDSAYLLYEAHRLGAQVQPYYIKTAFQPAFELEDAQRLCRHKFENNRAGYFICGFSAH